MKKQKDTAERRNRRYLWSVLFLVLAVLSVWAVTSQGKDFSPKKFLEYIDGNDPKWLAAAALAMLCYIGFDAAMIRCLLRGFGYPRRFPDCVSYAAADIYFSAITPSATGGQPMEGLYMARDGVPGVISAVVLLTYLLLYTVSIVIIGLLCLILMPGAFLLFGTLGRVLIAVGIGIQIALAVIYALLLWKKQLMFRICGWGLRLLAKLRIVRNLELRERKLRETMERYGRMTELLKGKRRLLFKTLLWNLAHRTSQILVTVCCFLAGGGAWQMAPKLFAMQSEVVLGAQCIPIPGSMGVTDFLMLDGFSALMSEQQATNLVLLARGTSFYICVLLCGAIVLIKYGIFRFRSKRTEDGAALSEGE
jgi:uncharacterized protein (TIRG00374 family)